MTQSRYDAVADFYASGFDSAGDPAIRGLLDLLGPVAGLHPCFAGGKDISGCWPADGSYYGEGHWTAGEATSALRRQVGANHRMLSTCLGTLRRHGLWLDQITEPLPEPGWDQADDADRKPVFLVARLIKLPPD
jgi:hypothetical protein